MKALLTRLSSNDEGTIGVLLLADKAWFSLELPWRDNQQRISCIPTGAYVLKWTLSPRFKRYTYQILEVPNRTGIRLHSGNLAGRKPAYVTHSLGCPLLGYKVGTIKKQRAVLDSRRAVADFERRANKQIVELEVRDV